MCVCCNYPRAFCVYGYEDNCTGAVYSGSVVLKNKQLSVVAKLKLKSC